LSRTVLGVSKLKNINPFYLMVFLRSYFGFNQLQRQRELTIQYQLTLDRVGKVLIPKLSEEFQLKIEKIAKESRKKQTRSKQLYKQAEELFLKELDLKDYKPKHTLTFETTKKETDKAKRIDADYFQPKYKEIIERIEKYENGFDIVKNIVTWKKGFEVGSNEYKEDGIPFIRVSDFSINGIKKTEKKLSEEIYKRLKKQFKPKKDEILFTKDGTIGLSYVLKEEFEGILSSAFLRLNLKQEFEKECLSLIFNSIVSKMQVEKLSGGAVIAHLKPSDFEKFKIPLIKPEIQKQIAEKIKESHKLRKESKEHLEDAKKKVEEEIEKEAKNN
ncbi:MAG: restriction endonuclease subunit S, partial [Candidatus Aenigmarchaeota archaeon]|nr:restriction endonuclease subunit S [Candidatus Aenigmarchaeota archaeon]